MSIAPPRLLVWLVCLGLPVLAGACVRAPNYFQPSERVKGTDAEGNRIAIYPLRGPSGVFGEAKLWTRGATSAERDGADRTFLHIGIEVHNTSAGPVRIPKGTMKADPVCTGDGLLTRLSPINDADLTIASQATAQRDYYFELPAGVWPHDVVGFGLAWAVTGGAQSYAKRTAFVELRYEHHHDAYVIYDSHHPHYWHYRRLGQCADPFCDTVIVYPSHRHGRTKRTRSHPK